VKEVIIYTDGGVNPNPGVGTFAALLIYGDKQRKVSGIVENTTNNRMELSAAIEGLKVLNQPCAVEIVTDSRYLESGFTKWLGKWARKGWRTSDGSAVENKDLWEILLKVSNPHTVKVRWVRGHNGDLYNEAVNNMCTELRKAFLRGELKSGVVYGNEIGF